VVTLLHLTKADSQPNRVGMIALIIQDTARGEHLVSQFKRSLSIKSYSKCRLAEVITVDVACFFIINTQVSQGGFRYFGIDKIDKYQYVSNIYRYFLIYAWYFSLI
jgi:hypothetical protein